MGLAFPLPGLEVTKIEYCFHSVGKVSVEYISLSGVRSRDLTVSVGRIWDQYSGWLLLVLYSNVDIVLEPDRCIMLLLQFR
jgi:hypothetical protein